MKIVNRDENSIEYVNKVIINDELYLSKDENNSQLFSESPRTSINYAPDIKSALDAIKNNL